MTKQSKESAPSESPAADAPSPDAVGSRPSPSAPSSRASVQVNEIGAAVCYANFCRVTGTPEELILDFGLNPQPLGGASTVEIKQRLVVNYYTAKRLLQALGMSIQRHETAFGTLETDVQKRVMPSMLRVANPR